MSVKISGFTMAKNAAKLYYPIKEAIASILPIVDEFVVALGDCDEDDLTLQEIESIGSDKIKIVHTVWDLEKYPRGMENAHQTDIAKSHCKGDWCFYLQADEVIHEKYLDHIVAMCEKYKDDKKVDGFLFKYKHFFGDYDHYNHCHGWYKNEIRIVRNDPTIHSFESAQSFRKRASFDGVSYRDKKGTTKLNVVALDAEVYHYGWVRPPEMMQKKSKALATIHKGEEGANALYEKRKEYFDYGALGKLSEFKEAHPQVMESFIARFDWKDKLNYSKNYTPNREKMKFERLRPRILTFIERTFFGGKEPFGYSNWYIVK